MVLSSQELQAKEEELARKEAQIAQRRRLSKAFKQRGDTKASGQFAAQSRRIRKASSGLRNVVTTRKTQLNPGVKFFDSGSLLTDDRELAAARLRSTSKAAAEAQQRIREAGGKGGKSKKIRELERVQFRTAKAAEKILSGKGDLTFSERKLIVRSRFPDLKSAKVASKAARPGTPEAGKAAAAAKRDRQIQQAKDAADFEGSTSDFIREQRAELESVRKEASVTTRKLFLASGKSKDASKAEVEKATRSLLKEGATEIRDARGNIFYRRPGNLAEKEGQLIGVRSVKRKSSKPGRLPAGLTTDSKGRTVLIREGAKSQQKAADIFKVLGAPERKKVAKIGIGPGKFFRGVRKIGEGSEKLGARIVDTSKERAERIAAQPAPKTVLGKALRSEQSLRSYKDRLVGGFLKEEGKTLKEKPVTAGAGEAVAIGAGFGVVSKSIRVVKQSAKVGTLLRGVAKAAQGVEVVGGTVLGGLFVADTAVRVKEAPTPEAKGGVLAKQGTQFAGFVGGAAGGAKAVSGGVAAVKSVRSDIQIARLSRKLKGQLVTSDAAARELATVSKDVSLNVKARPIEQRVRLTDAKDEFGVRQEEFFEKEILGRPQEIPGSQLPKPGDKFLVTRLTRTETVTARQGQSKPALEGESLFGRKFQEGISRRVTTSKGIEKDAPLENIFVQRDLPGKAPEGVRIAERKIEVEVFEPFSESGIRDVTVTKGRPGAKAPQPKKIGFQPKEVSAREQPIQVEALRPFSEAKGDVIALNRQTGEFSLLRQTEFRRFQRGTEGIPGRRVLTEGRLPEAAEVNKNLPRELAREFKDTPAGRKFLGKQPLRIEKIERAQKSSKKKSSPLEPGDVEITSGGQVFIQKAIPKTETKQKTQEVRSSTIEQELKTEQKARQKQEQDSFNEQIKKGRSLTQAIKKTQFSAILSASRAKTRFKQGLAALSIQKALSGQRIRLESSVASKQATSQAQSTAQASKLATDLKVGLQAKTRAKTKARIDVKQRFRTLRTRIPKARTLLGIETPKPKVTTKPLSFETKRDKRGVAGFNVLVKRRGQFRKVTNIALSKAEAIELGARVADFGPAQQFKIVETREKVTGRARVPPRSQVKNILGKFTRTKIGFKEKQKNLIDTAGEVQKISLKGVQASLTSRKRKGGLKI